MENKERVIVIDLVGDGEETVKKAGKADGHECRCGVCNCHEKHEPEQLELQLQLHEFSDPGTRSAGTFSRPTVSPEPMEAVKKYIFKH